MAYVTTIKGNSIYYNNEKIFLDSRTTPYKIRAANEKYEVVGLHSYNPGCYKYLEEALIINKETGEYKILRLWPVLGKNYNDEGSKLEKITKAKNGFIVISQNGKGFINPEVVFGKAVKVGDTINPKYDPGKLETYFIYEICHGNDVLMTLKEEVPRTQLLRWPGFDLSYNAFKFSGIGAMQSSLAFINTENNHCWSIDWGNSTTLTSDEVWKKKKELYRCMKTVIPTHPGLRDDMCVVKYEAA